MPAKIKLMLILMSFIQFAIDMYVFNKFRAYIKRTGKHKIIYQLLFVLAFIMLPLSIYISNYGFKNPVRDTLHNYLFFGVSIWWMSKVPAFIFLLIKDIFSFFIRRKPIKKPELEKRRDFLITTGWALGAVPIIVTSKSGMIAEEEIKIRAINMPIKDLDPNLEGYTISQISDLHLGSFFDKRIMKSTIEKLQNLNTDLITITGDFVNRDPLEYKSYYNNLKVFQSYKNVYACLGNHDHYMNSRDHNNLIDMINSSGIKLLINENRIIENSKKRFNLAAIDNTGQGQRFGDFAKTFSNQDRNLNTILLAHDPRNWDDSIVGKQKVDLTLSGHTHGGQIVFEFMNEKFSPVQMIYNQWAGYYTKNNQSIYVNTGLGTVGPPIRIGVPPEITVFKLKRI